MTTAERLREAADDLLATMAADPAVHVCAGCNYDIDDCNQGPDC